MVSADREQAVIGGIVNEDAWGVYTDDPAVVLVAVEYVRHDIAMHLIAEKLAPADFEAFWTSSRPCCGCAPTTVPRPRCSGGAPAPPLRRLRCGVGLHGGLREGRGRAAEAPARRWACWSRRAAWVAGPGWSRFSMNADLCRIYLRRGPHSLNRAWGFGGWWGYW